jgi:hypothetical protein
MVQRHYTMYKKILGESNDSRTKKQYELLLTIEAYWRRTHPGRRVTQTNVIETLMLIYDHVTDPVLRDIPTEKRVKTVMDLLNGKE